MPDPLLVAVAVTAVGWVWGSFLNQLVDRTPLRPPRHPPRHPPGAAPGADARLGLFRPPRSICLSCGRAIPWHDNLPVLSYLLLRGRCRRCGAAIGARTLVLEAVTPAAFLALPWLAPGPSGLGVAFPWGYAVLSWGLVALALLTERRRLSPLFLLLGAGCALGVLLAV